MSDLFGLPLLAATAAAVAVALLAGVLVRPRQRLAGRFRPYTVVARSMLGRTVDVTAVTGQSDLGTLRRIFGPPLTALASRVGRIIDSTTEEGLLRKLRQAGMLQSTPESVRVQEYRVRQLALSVVGGTAGFAFGVLLARPTAIVLALSFAGFVAGASYWRAKVDRAIEARQNRMRIELYTTNQLLAMRIRVGGGVVSAVRHLVERGSGAVVEELAEALRLHQSGMPASQAFRRIAALTPEPHARRAYQVLASADERGSDLAEALLALSEDIRDDRREAMRREATRRRATMLIPIIAILAPVLILFVAAPLPWIVLRGLG
ncbi:MAG: type II secretion system F family protein [Acidimicrobiia bacterium]|nr:type II secretion system F family protein [Acidimicrobiia bacterium]